MLRFFSLITPPAPTIPEEKWLHEYMKHEMYGNKIHALRRITSLRSLHSYHKETYYAGCYGISNGSYIVDISFDLSGRTFAAATLEGNLYIQHITDIEANTNTQIQLGSTSGDTWGGRIDIGHRMESCKWNPVAESNELACCFSSYRDILVYDLSVSQKKATCSLQGSDSSKANGGGILDFEYFPSRGGTGVIGGGRDGILRIWDFRSGNRDVMSKNKTVSQGAIQAVCMVSSDGSAVATGTELGQLTLYDLRYFGPPLQDVFLPNMVPLPSHEGRPSTTYQPVHAGMPRSHNHAIHALAVGRRGVGMSHVLAFQLRGSCRIGLYDIFSNTSHLIEPQSSCSSYHNLTRGRIAFSHIDSTLFYGDTSNHLQAVDCGCVTQGIRASHAHHNHTIPMASPVTCVATNPFGVVAIGLESSDVVLCNNRYTGNRKPANDDIIDCTE